MAARRLQLSLSRRAPAVGHLPRLTRDEQRAHGSPRGRREMLGPTTGRARPRGTLGSWALPTPPPAASASPVRWHKAAGEGKGGCGHPSPRTALFTGGQREPLGYFSIPRSARLLPREAACSRQFPSPVVARGSSRWQLGSTFAHQFRRPGEITESVKTGPVARRGTVGFFRSKKKKEKKKKKKDEECSLLGLRWEQPRTRAACPVCGWKKGAKAMQQKGQSVGTWGAGQAARTGREREILT